MSEAGPTSPAARPRTPLDQAVALHQSGRFPQARQAYLALLSTEPGNGDAWGLLGTVECQLGNLEAGVACLARALDLGPDQPKVHLNLGAALLKLQRFEAALEAYDRALALAPDFVEAWCGRGVALKELARFEEALESQDRALALRPDGVEAHNNRANVLKDLRRSDEALAGYRAALDLQPRYGEALYNLGNLLLKLRRLDEASATFDRVLELHPGFPDALWSQSLVKLLRGDLAEGWRLYEWRWRCRHAAPPRPFQVPRWTGAEDLRGKTLLIHPEQGLGDILQFSRYALMARDRGARVVLEAPRSLVPLLASLPRELQVVAEGDPLPPFDLHCPIMSLPLAMGTRLETIPAPVPYLQADPELIAGWAARLGTPSRPRVGLFWSGNLANRHRAQRSLPTAHLASLLDLPLDFHALEYEVSAADAALLQAWPNLDLHPGQPKDFANTAALMASLDLVISIDSSIAHLAGALGKPVWILLPFTPDFRWMLDRPDSPWYPTARLFRQPALDDWTGLVAEVRAALEGRYQTEFC